MKVVVTGATGFVGRWLVNELLLQNDDITVIVRNKDFIPKEWRTSVHIVESTLEQAVALKEEDFPVGNPDIFFHLAWDGTSGSQRANVQLQLRNVQFTCGMVALAKRLHCSRFVNAGSIMEYEAMQYIPEDGAEPDKGNVYSAAKLVADLMAKTEAVNLGIDYINAVISNIYGVGECSERFLNATFRKMLRNERISLTHGEQLYDFIYVSDAVKAIVIAGKKGEKNSAYYIGNSKQYPLKYFVLQMREILGSKSELLFGEVPFKGAMLRYDEFDIHKIEYLGYKPEIDFSEGLNLMREWMVGKENGN